MRRIGSLAAIVATLFLGGGGTVRAGRSASGAGRLIWLCIRLAIKHLKGEKLEKRYLIPCPAITKENAAEFKGQF